MLVTRIIDALRTLVMHLRFGVRSPSSTSYPPTVQEPPETKSTLSEPSAVTREDPGSDSAILVEVEHEESGSSPSSTNEDYQYFPNEDTRHTESLGQQPGTGHKPSNIGGKRGGQTTKPQPKPKQPPSSRPELVCRKVHGSGMWEVVLTADDECLLSAVHLESKALCPSNKECRVPSLKGHLVVSCQNETEHDIPLFGNEPLIFKLRKNWAGEGRKTSRITNGHFIVITPDTWERTGHAPVEPDNCSDAAFQAHYFYRDATTPNEDVDGFREYNVLLNASGIDLTGQRVYDDSEEGALFVGVAPILKSSPGIVWARVGKESDHGWKGENFEPGKQSLSEVLNGREGRFFLRVYDSQTRLFDSTEFRYLHNLKQIQVNGMQYTKDTVLMPHSSGYPPTEICFVCAEGTTISPVMLSEATNATVRSDLLDVPPHPDADHIWCTLGCDTSGVNIILELPRIWWRMEYDRNNADPWRDTPLVMTRQEFQNHARKNATMYVLSKRFQSVRVGFDDELDRVCRRTTEEDRISIPLTEFVDYEQIDKRQYDDASFNVEWAGEVLPLIRISADPMPEIVSFSEEPATISAGQEAILQWATLNAGQACVVIDPDIGEVDFDGTCSVRPTKTTKYTLTLAVSGTDDVTRSLTVTVDSPTAAGNQPTARVRCAARGWRNGKGFSSRELQDAGLTVQTADRYIPFDRRRRSSHPVNVKEIRRMLNA